MAVKSVKKRVYLRDMFPTEAKLRRFEAEVVRVGNIRQVANKYGLLPITVWQHCRRNGIETNGRGRPTRWNLNEAKLLPKLKEASKVRGGMRKMADALGVPYYVVYNLAVKNGL